MTIMRACPKCNGTGQVQADRRFKLSDTDVLEIRERRANGESGKSLAQEFSVSESAISRLVNGRERTGIT